MTRSARSRRAAWLSLTPEPERELPVAIATLRAGGPPTPEQVAAESARAERLVLRGSRRRWLAWLSEGLEAAEEAGTGVELDAARELVHDVVANHHALTRGLPGDTGPTIAADEAMLARVGRTGEEEPP